MKTYNEKKLVLYKIIVNDATMYLYVFSLYRLIIYHHIWVANDFLYIGKRKLDQEGDSDNFDDMDVHFTTTYGVVGKLLQEVTEDDKQKVLEFLNNHPDNEMATMWSIRFHIQDRKPNVPTLNAEEVLPKSGATNNKKKMPIKRKY